nr:hypothetical protein FEE99_22335 [Pseudomonas sp. ef1]
MRQNPKWPEATLIPCGSEPAREDGSTFNINVPDQPLSRAGSLPQCSPQICKIPVPLQKPPLSPCPHPPHQNLPVCCSACWPMSASALA